MKKTALALLLLALLLLAGAALPARGDDPDADAAVKKVLGLAIEKGAPLYNEGQPAACAAVYEVAAASALALGGDRISKDGRAALEKAVRDAASEGDASARAWIFRRAFDRVLGDGPTGDSGFRFVREAALPEGFPEPGPVGEIVTKEYPRYRLARAEGGSTSFWRLFLHIKARGVSMTAPVEMTMEAVDDGELRQTEMAFLYERPDQGETGKAGSVTVIDGPPVRVLSLGMTGPVTRETLAAARKALTDRLAKSPDLARDGDFRLLGYNSPMIPENRRFFELQLPVRPAE